MLDHGADHPLVLEPGQCWSLSGRAGRAQQSGALVDLPVDHSPQSSLVKLTVTQRSNERDCTSREHLSF